MKIELRKTDHLYGEFITYMSYRYAIGLTAGRSEWRDRQLEQQLTWFSYHYAMHRHSYAASLCDDIAVYAPQVMSTERQQFTAVDIRREIANTLRYHSLSFQMPLGFEDTHGPLDTLIRFLVQNGIDTEEKLATDEFARQCEFIRGKPVILDTLAARIFGVSVTDVRQAISRSKKLFSEEVAFHLTFEELSNRYRGCLNPPKLRRSDYLPYAITQQGFCLLSMRLRSTIAIKMNICIIETVSAHIPLREQLKSCTLRD